jgi:hypothetical protein
MTKLNCRFSGANLYCFQLPHNIMGILFDSIIGGLGYVNVVYIIRSRLFQIRTVYENLTF